MIICAECGRGIPSGIRSQCICRQFGGTSAEELARTFGISTTFHSAFETQNPRGIKRAFLALVTAGMSEACRK